MRVSFFLEVFFGFAIIRILVFVFYTLGLYVANDFFWFFYVNWSGIF